MKFRAWLFSLCLCYYGEAPGGRDTASPNGHGGRATPNDECHDRRVRSLTPPSTPAGHRGPRGDIVSLCAVHAKVLAKLARRTG